MNDNYYFLSKEIFKHKLNTSELRLCIILNSKKIEVEELKWEEIKYIDNKHYAKYLKEYSLNLKEKGLIGKPIKNKFIKFKEMPIFKSQRQLFFLCFEEWGTEEIIVSLEHFKLLFGSNTRDINRNWKNTKEQLNMNEWQFKEDKNRIIISKKDYINELYGNMKKASIEDIEKALKNLKTC